MSGAKMSVGQNVWPPGKGEYSVRLSCVENGDVYREVNTDLKKELTTITTTNKRRLKVTAVSIVK